MKQFLTELSELMDKHGAEIIAIEECIGYSSYLDRIEFQIDSKYIDGEQVRGYSCVKAGTILNAEDIKNLIK